jgi:amino acid permease
LGFGEQITIGEIPGNGTSMWPVSFVDILTTIPVFIFSFTCHQNLFSIANEIVDPTVERLTTVAGSAIGTAGAMYMTCMVCGYGTFGRLGIEDNFLMSLPPNWVVRIGKCFMAVAAALSYPLQLHPCRKSMIVVIKRILARVCQDTEYYEYPQAGERVLRRIFTTVIIAGTTVIATFLDKLGPTFQVVGVVGSNTVCLIMPAYLFIQTFRGKPGVSPLKLAGAYAQFILGLTRHR